ncbi:phosphatidylcholine:ceramide cholinephosphotransferase 2 [Osmerus eperlanus]|uniref:phosphatidylcholine:ceramide cholinephosphotransferase 2 n=1 Tax=Osmerus eperlanus TaxID=29151 RepID=UPI002E134CEF
MASPELPGERAPGSAQLDQGTPGRDGVGVGGGGCRGCAASSAQPNGAKPCPAHKPGGDDSGRPGRHAASGLRKALGRHRDYVKISVPDAKAGRPPPMEWWKTGLAFLYAVFNLVLTTVVITVVHERVPAKESSPPLPDKFFDYVDRVKWAFTVTEVNGMVLVGIWGVQLLFHRYRAIAGRRFLFLIGTLYLYRCVTMYITTLPVPGMHMTCAPKLHGDSQAKMQRVLQLISGGGLSITGSHLMCGDFLYSGHTVMLTLTYLFIKESLEPNLSQALRCSPNNYLTHTWWNPVFNFFERNVQTQVPCSYSWPVSWPPACLKNPCKKYSMVQSTREE